MRVKMLSGPGPNNASQLEILLGPSISSRDCIKRVPESKIRQTRIDFFQNEPGIPVWADGLTQYVSGCLSIYGWAVSIFV